jgi:molybdopterin-guanine dinucleotide biosynthesis protein A
MRSGIILAGGRSTRFGGGEKSLKPVNGQPMICHVREAIKPLVDEIIVSVRDEVQRNRVFPYLLDGITLSSMTSCTTSARWPASCSP